MFYFSGLDYALSIVHHLSAQYHLLLRAIFSVLGILVAAFVFVVVALFVHIDVDRSLFSSKLLQEYHSSWKDVSILTVLALWQSLSLVITGSRASDAYP